MSDSEIVEVSSLADGFSGADMRCLCQEASMNPIRKLSIEQLAMIEATEVFKEFFNMNKVIKE